MNRFMCILSFCIIFSFSGTGICYSDDGPEVSDAIKEKYTPLVEAFQKSFDKGDYANALIQIQSIVKSAETEKELNPTHPAIIQLNAMMAMTYMKLKKYKEAETLLVDLDSRLEKNKLSDSEIMLFLQEVIRDMYMETGNKAKSDSADAKAKQLREKHPEWIKDDNNENTYDKYQSLFQKAFEMMDDNPREAIKAAIATAEQAEKELGSAHPVAIQANIILAQLYMNTEDYTSSESTLDKAKSSLEAAKKTSTMDMIFVLRAYMDLYEMQGNGGKADAIESKIKDMVSKNTDLRKQYDEEQKKQAEKAKEMEKDGGDGANSRNSKNKFYYDEMNKINQNSKFGDPEDGIKNLEGLKAKAQKELSPNDRFFIDIDRNVQDFTIRMYMDRNMPDKAQDLVKKRIAELEKNAKQDMPALADSYLIMGSILERMNKQDDAAGFYEKAYQTVKKAMDFSKDEKSIMNNSMMLVNIGRELFNYYDRQGKYPEAEALIKEQMNFVNKYQPDDMRMLDLNLSLARMYEMSKKTAESDDLYKQAAKLLDKVQANPPKENEADKKKGMSIRTQLAGYDMQVGFYYRNNGKAKEARNYFEKAKKIVENDKDAESLRILSQVADYYVDSGMRKEAEQLYSILLPLFDKQPEMRKSDLADFYFQLGRFYASDKKDNETLKYYQLAMDTYKQDEKPDSSRILNVLRELKNYYESRGKNEEVLKTLDRMQELYKNSQDSTNKDKSGTGVEIVRIYSQKANSLRSQAKNGEAEKTIEEMIAAAKSKYGDKSREYAIALMEKANYYNPEPDTKVDIEGLYRGAIDILEIKTVDSRELADALSSLGRIVMAKGNDNERAISLLKRAVALEESSGKQGDPRYVNGDLAFAYLKSGTNPDEAEKCFKKAIDADNKSQRPDDFWMTGLLINFGQLYFNRGAYAEAERIWKQDEELMIRTADNNKGFRPDFNSLYDWLIRLYEKTGNQNELKKYQNKQKNLQKR